MKDSRPRQRGFTLVESVVTILLFSSIGVLGARIMLSSTRAGLHSKNVAKATALANMVFDHYYAAVLQNFDSLTAYDHPEGILPKTFFQTPDNFGYDGFTIISTTTYSDSRSLATVSVGVDWVLEGKHRVSQFSRSFTERLGRAQGGVIQVRVSACDTCPGLPGFEVTADPSVSDDGSVRGITDSQGLAVLSGVKVSNATNIQVSHPVTRYDQAGSQGYVVDGTSATTQALSVPVLAQMVNVLTITNFRALGSITGLVKNNSPDLNDGQGAPGDGMQIALSGVSAADGSGGFTACTDSNPCTVQTTAVDATTGRFGFYGILAGNAVVTVQGISGSDPAIQRSDPAFHWGYTGGNVQTPATLTWRTDGSIPSLAFDGQSGPMLNLYRMGWLDLRTTDTSGTAVPATVDCLVQVSPWRSSQVWSEVPTDNSGIGRIYNALVGLGEDPVQCQAYRDPQGGDHGLYTPYNTQTCTSVSDCLGGARFTPLTMTPGSMLQGTLTNGSGGFVSGAVINVAQVGVDMEDQLGRNLASTKTGADGKFTIDGYFQAGYVDVQGPWWEIALDSPVSVTNITQPIAIYDDDRQALVANAPADLWTDGGLVGGLSPWIGKSDSTGHLTYQGSLSNSLFATQAFVPCAPNAVCSFNLVQPQQVALLLQSFNDFWSPGGIMSAIVQSNIVYSMQTLHVKLNYHQVTGQVTDTRGHPLQGIQVVDPSGNAALDPVKYPASTLTDATGHYAMKFRVTGRSSGSTGACQILIPAGQTDSLGNAYSASPTLPLSLLPTADPEGAPFVQNFQLTASQDGGGL